MVLDTFTLLLALTTVWLFTFVFLPWVGRTGALYALHALRDQVFLAGLNFPDAMGTALYRDVDLILSHAIFVVREQSTVEAMRYFAPSNGKSAPSQPGRAEVYRREIDSVFVGADGLSTLLRLLESFDRVNSVLCLRVFTGHPALQVLGVVTVSLALFLKVKDAFVRVYCQVSPLASLDEVSDFVARAHQPRSGGDELQAAFGILRRQASRA